MGGALALHTAYRWESNLAGVFAFSSFLNDNSVVYEELKKCDKNGKTTNFIEYVFSLLQNKVEASNLIILLIS